MAMTVQANRLLAMTVQGKYLNTVHFTFVESHVCVLPPPPVVLCVYSSLSEDVVMTTDPAGMVCVTV